MKATSLFDLEVDTSTLNLAIRNACSWRKLPPDANGISKPELYIKAGAVIEGPQALAMCFARQCRPADEECAKAYGKTDAEIDASSLEYQMDAMGMDDKDDRILFRQGVITGFTPEKEYIHGPNWDSYHAALAATPTEEI